MPHFQISQAQAQKIVLHAQKLLHPPKIQKSLGSLEESLEAIIQHLGYIQIDTISVVARAHHHVLWTRLNCYQPAMLESLVAEKRVFEYWHHAASYLPMADYRFCLPRMERMRNEKPRRFDRSHPLYQNVLQRIREEGALQAKDFQGDRTPRHGWWDWKPAKQALEQLFLEGRLLVAGRKGFQKIYDLPERVLPPGIDQTTPTQQELARFFILRSIQAHGIITEPQTRYLKKITKKEGESALCSLQEEGIVVPVRVGKCPDDYWTFPHCLEQPLRLPRKKRLFFLSPFDNLLIQRNRMREFFGFDYQLECYLPQAKRQYGYFSLPMLWGERFVGRVDMKAERQSKTLILKNFVLEGKVPPWEALAAPLQQALLQFMAFNGCEKFVVLQTHPKSMKAKLKF